MVRRWVNDEGRTCISGDRDLKSSQAYPAGFGAAIAEIMTLNQRSMQEAATAMTADAIRLMGGVQPVATL
eukprot:11627900-Alexandrium_andersonii.AAC.1